MLASCRADIESGALRVLLLDECHLLWGDLSGYVWGRTDQPVSINVVNQRQKQTYYGAIDYVKRTVLLKEYDAGNSENTVSYLQYLQAHSPDQRLLILWDGASYHRSEVVRDFLAQINQGQAPERWQIRCVCFAPNCPQQNPIEDVWLQAKTWVRRFCSLASSFAKLKWLFDWFLQHTTFDFPKLQLYGAFSPLN